ncbi:hypothetical protein [Enterobacter hormaechei]|uniref:hypothetical protein n=1 Tax=Enterobacter hormaechei TaxID=158836 RepID=UPI0002E64A06|nr:hypothetical protein [Enterobacter hormaechei]
MTLTKEWLLKTIAELEEERDATAGAVNEDAANALAAMKIALASLEAEKGGEPVAKVETVGVCWYADNGVPRKPAVGTELYAAPPAPVAVPEPIKRNDADGWWMYKGHRVGGGCAEWYNRALDDCRAAMLQGAEHAESPTTMQTSPALDSSPKIAESPSGNSSVIPDCSCRTCRPVTISDMRFVVCPDCGNKRCPHANDHRQACTVSNEPGQEGSAYPAAPQQKV